MRFEPMFGVWRPRSQRWTAASVLAAAACALLLFGCDDGPAPASCDDAQCNDACVAGGYQSGVCQESDCECLSEADGDGDGDGDSDADSDGDVQCSSDDECTDDLFCNGEERCDPGAGADDFGCVPADDGPCLPSQTCDEETDACLSACDVDPDADDDGFDAVNCGGDDCDDADDAINPSATEIAGDEIDQNCDGREICFADADGDGFRGDEEVTVESDDVLCDDAGEASADVPDGDCDDLSEDVYPDAGELPGDGIDGDCDGVELCYVDSDGDGYRSVAETTTASPDLTCQADGEALALLPTGDCDDGDESINPAAAEVVADGVDQNCDGVELCFLDGDQDGYLPDDTTLYALSDDLDCIDAGEGDSLTPGGDCDDADRLVNPGQAEVVGDGRDQNCDGQELCYVDGDGDGYRVGTETVVSVDLDCDDPGEIEVLSFSGDCDDADDDVHPYAPERCNDADDDCDGDVDEDLHRVCGTDVGLCESGVQTCTAGDWGECEGSIDPYIELCTSSELDEDCDGAVDEGCGCSAGDTRPCGPSTSEGICQPGTQTCDSHGQWGDCDAVYPETEVCDEDGLDEDCDGEVNEDGAEGCIEQRDDVDGDGFRGPSSPIVCRCGEPPLQLPDCDDDDEDVYPHAPERCNGHDDDCDTYVDEIDALGCTDYYPDLDDDGYGDEHAEPRCLCAPSGVYDATNDDDCCDMSSDTHPGATAWHIAPNGCLSFDYDCDGVSTRRWTHCGGCDVVDIPPCSHDPGWAPPAISGDCTIPSCGAPQSWRRSCAPNPLLVPICLWANELRIQECN